jgi:hypothetical protein
MSALTRRLLSASDAATIFSVRASTQSAITADPDSSVLQTVELDRGWTALIALLAVKFLQLQARFPWSLSRLIALLRQQLFVYRDLWL